MVTDVTVPHFRFTDPGIIRQLVNLSSLRTSNVRHFCCSHRGSRFQYVRTCFSARVWRVVRAIVLFDRDDLWIFAFEDPYPLVVGASGIPRITLEDPGNGYHSYSYFENHQFSWVHVIRVKQIPGHEWFLAIPLQQLSHFRPGR